eukprot:TRINITY_DN2829_c0_g1_i5.p1 TRINITY_DN2829_c0_g1~~TRINITY_DN2829_c0_g1_i5.p1  ORF type:complete len:109 (+),score=21.10 TRINITY_DN2829_c0_g1_i5:172-498(+)
MIATGKQLDMVNLLFVIYFAYTFIVICFQSFIGLISALKYRTIDSQTILYFVVPSLVCDAIFLVYTCTSFGFWLNVGLVLCAVLKVLVLFFTLFMPNRPNLAYSMVPY